MNALFSSPLGCSELDRTLSLEACDEHERARALAHAEDCPVCGNALAELGTVGRTLRGVTPLPPLRAERARIWRGIAARQRPTFQLSWLAVGGLAAASAAMAVLMIVSRTPTTHGDAVPMVMGELTPVEGPLAAPDTAAPSAAAPAALAAAPAKDAPRAMPVSRWVRAPRPVSADLGLAQVKLDAGAVLALEPRAPGEMDLRLFRGKAALHVEKLAPSEAFEVTTPLARVKVVGTKFRVESKEDVTHIEVEEGTVWVFESGSSNAKVVQAGQALDVRAPASPREVLSEARALLDSDATSAARMAGTLVDRGAAPEVEVEAILVLADAERRKGDPAKAANLYRRAADHAHGAPYAEEALYKCAMLLGSSGDAAGALAVLSEAERRVGMGAIGPERASLEAELHMTAGDRAAASEAFGRASARAKAMGDDASAKLYAERRAHLGR